ncbi:MAG: DUF397 domain-containing protein [Pseudonocardiaceae bacterium]
MNTQRNNKRHIDTTFTRWRKSSFSNPNGNECVEVSFSDNGIGMRDSHNPDSAQLVVHHGQWAVFLDGIAAGELRPA